MHTANPDRTLNPGQQAAADGFFEFLMSKERYMILSGAGGYGKTFLMGYFIDHVLPRYHELCNMMNISIEYDEVVMTATTNMAAEQLTLATGRPSGTIHSFLSLKIKEDYKTGRTSLSKSNAWSVHQRKVIFIDECSGIDSSLLHYIEEGTMNCKVVFVGDKYQAGPIMETISPIYAMSLTEYELTQPMRNADQPALQELCTMYREVVRSSNFLPFKVVPGVVDWLNQEQMEAEMVKLAEDKGNDRILAYTNDRVVDYNGYLRGLRNLPPHVCAGDRLINNSMVTIATKKSLSTEEQITILDVGEPYEAHLPNDGTMIVYPCSIEDRYGETFYNVPIPADREHFKKLLKYYAQAKDWGTYFSLKNRYPDLRDRDASTIHKAQGSTHDTVYVDLDDLCTCTNPLTAARLFYVAVSRARKRVVFYGNLSKKYGG